MPQSHQLPLLTQGFRLPRLPSRPFRQRCTQLNPLLIRSNIFRNCSQKRQSQIQMIWASILKPLRQELQVSRRHWQQRQMQVKRQFKLLKLRHKISQHLSKTWLLLLFRSKQRWSVKIKQLQILHSLMLINSKLKLRQGLHPYRRHRLIQLKRLLRPQQMLVRRVSLS